MGAYRRSGHEKPRKRDADSEPDDSPGVSRRKVATPAAASSDKENAGGAAVRLALAKRATAAASAGDLAKELSAVLKKRPLVE